MLWQSLKVRFLNLSGAESLSVAANIFLGQTESPFMIKAYLEKMSKSEILLVMSGGMATYLLCGFANFASIGIQIGGIGSLAPGKRLLLSQYGLRALLAGTLASMLSATMVGMILG